MRVPLRLGRWALIFFVVNHPFLGVDEDDSHVELSINNVANVTRKKSACQRNTVASMAKPFVTPAFLIASRTIQCVRAAIAAARPNIPCTGAKETRVNTRRDFVSLGDPSVRAHAHGWIYRAIGVEPFIQSAGVRTIYGASNPRSRRAHSRRCRRPFAWKADRRIKNAADLVAYAGGKYLRGPQCTAYRARKEAALEGDLVDWSPHQAFGQ